MRDELEESFAALAAAELAGLRRFGYTLCGDWSRADDLVQSTLERMYRVWPRIHDIGAPDRYARKVLARLAISETRRPWWRREQPTQMLPETPVEDAVAEILGIAPGTVKRQCHDAMTHLRVRLGDDARPMARQRRDVGER